MPITLSMEDGATLELGGMSEYIGSAYAPQVDVTDTPTGHEVAITYDDAATGITTKTFDVADGHDGADGYSPTATVTQLADGATIRITDKDGTTTATVHDGADGHDGSDGFSPTARVTQTATGATISITDKDGTTTATVSNGTDGADGSDGADGFSPTVDVQEIEGGHEVTITDAQGPHSFDVMDGDPAEPGSITDAMLAPDGIKTEVEWLWGNQLIKELSGELMQASDAYGAPMLSLGVDGKSTQDGTPTPDAPVPIESVEPRNILPNTVYQLAEDGNTIVAGVSFRSMWCEVEPNTKYTLSRSVAKGNRFGVYTTTTEPAAGVALTLLRSPASDAGVLSFTFTTPSDARYVFIYLANNGSDISGSDMQLERGFVATSYMPHGSIVIDMCGKNLFDIANAVFGGNATYAPEKTETGVVSRANLATGWAYVDTYVGNIGAPTVTLSVKPSTSTPRIAITGYDIDGTVTFSVASATSSITANVPSGTARLRLLFYARPTASGAIDDSCTYDNIQLELGSTATAYEPYTGHTVPIDLQDHVLRSLPDGTKDTLALSYLKPSTRDDWAWYSRELVQRVGVTTLDGSKTWNSGGSSYNGNVGTDRFVNIAGMRNTGSLTNNDSLLSEELRHTGDYIWSNPDVNIWKCTRFNGQAHVVFDNATVGITSEATDINRTALIKAWLSEHPITMHYPLATPITTQLDPIELPVLPAPTCTVWADPTTGLQMEYVRDSNLVVQSLSAETAIAYASIATVDGPTATASHAVGTYLTMGGTLYKVTQAIAVGETIAAGTNVTQTTVMAELIARTA